MNISLNGNKVECKDKITVQEILQQNSFLESRIAVEVNGDIVPKSQYGAFYLSESDTMEVVTFVGGG